MSNESENERRSETIVITEECLKSCESRLEELQADETMCLNISLDAKADRKDVIAAINEVTTSMTIYDGDVD